MPVIKLLERVKEPGAAVVSKMVEIHKEVIGRLRTRELEADGE